MNKHKIDNLEKHRQELIKENNTLNNLLEIERQQVKRLAEQLNLCAVGSSLTDEEKIDYKISKERTDKEENLNNWVIALWTSIMIILCLMVLFKVIVS